MAARMPGTRPAKRFPADGRRTWPTAARKPRSTLIFHVERILLAIYSLNCWLPDAVGVAWLNTHGPFPGVMALGTGQNALYRTAIFLITLRNAQVRRISWVRGVRPARERHEWPPHDAALG